MHGSTKAPRSAPTQVSSMKAVHYAMQCTNSVNVKQCNILCNITNQVLCNITHQVLCNIKTMLCNTKSSVVQYNEALMKQ